VDSFAEVHLGASSETQEQESRVKTALALVLAGSLFLLALSVILGNILGWHDLPFPNAQAARAYFGPDLAEVFHLHVA